MNNNDNCYKTSDLGLATAISLYFPIESIEFKNKHKVLFVFLSTPDLEEFVQMYWCGELKIEPQEYINQIKIIKTRIYNQV